MEGQDEVSAREQHFHSQVRESTICFLLFAILYVVSYFIITRYKRKSGRRAVGQSWLTVASTSWAQVILQPQPPEYPALQMNKKMKMPSSTGFRLWNLASLFSNLCLFVLMPFAFFFLESEGFAGLKKGIRARILETLVMLLLLALLILGIVWVASALIDNDAASMESLYDLWEFYLPYLYSCISLMGCLLLLLCTPVGLSRMFTVMGQLLVKPTILEDLDEQIYIITLEEEALQRRLNGLSSSVEYNIMELEQELENVKTLKTKLERRKKASAWERNLVYPAVMVLLLIETSISVLLVACNILCLLVDETAMPKGTRGPGIGNASLSTFGFVGAALEIILIFYLMVSSVVGFYSLRFFGNFTPKKDDTTMTKIIGNCVSILVLSSALPVMSRTLGITRFDLLGDFGRFNWLGNFYIVLSYNLLFAIVTTLCLVRKFTSAVREELFKALGLHKLHLPNTSRDSETAKPSVNGHQKAL
ncbi:limb region 1 protein homolog isoform X2 [Gorilla gorilla gorilla]|uniref:limb region 1 protein homolog isoform X1 n=2 Tax=Homininae TaxID=207598 RepID=UPI001FB1898A|nr:limb region 1 protein homolog isoform X1 [Homo sapiens]XP_055203362.1 limb region 1 protein homolog isoform X2 [Gorilla gorilla gorilla]